MSFDKELIQNIIEEFKVDNENLQEIAANFRQDLQLGLKQSESTSLKMLKSYVSLPSGKEIGEYLALDFGGTNVRVSKIKLKGNGQFEVVKKIAKPLTSEHISSKANANDLFNFIAELIDEAIDFDHSTKFYLGHTFSFPSSQTNLYNAKLIVWTKEFTTAGVEGKVVNDLLKEALNHKGITNVEPVSVINDTVAVLLSTSYQHTDTFIGSIYATGHNTCYLEPSVGMILNLESGGFMKLTPNRFDLELDSKSEKPNEQRLEKMVSGRYMGELFSIVMNELFNEKLNCKFTSIDLSNIIEHEEQVKNLIESKLNKQIGEEDSKAIKDIVSAIVIRSARLVTATYVGLIWQITGSKEIVNQHIAIDGSVYEKMPLVKESINQAFNELLDEDAIKVDTLLDNGGSGLGAAISAAIASATN